MTIREGGIALSTHHVRVWASDLALLAPALTDPAPLVKASFRFLLERESHRAILPSFDLLEIARYFPEYEATIRRGAPTA